MNKRAVKISVFVAIMIIPVLIAVIAFAVAQVNPVSRRSVTEMSVSSPDGKTYFYNADASLNPEGKELNAIHRDVLLDALFVMNSSGKKVDVLPMSEDSYSCFEVTYKSHNKTSDYKYYLTRDPDNAYYLDSSGKYHKISESAAKNFLATEYAICVYPSASQPVLTVGDKVNVLPYNMEWKFLGYDDKYYDVTAATTDEFPFCTVSGGLEIKFDQAPDYLHAVMKDTDGETVFDGMADDIDSSLFSNNCQYDVVLSAKWYETEGRNNYGEATYEFRANVLSPAVFYLNTQKIEYGDFVIISAKNVVDKSQITFASEPAINFKPRFFEYGGLYHAIVPVSLDCIEKNDSAKRYTFTLMYGDAQQELLLDVSVRKPLNAYPQMTTAQYNSNYSAEAREAFLVAISGALSTKINDLYWMSDSLLVGPTDKAVKFGFGANMRLTDGNIFTHYGVDYKVKTDDTVSACLPGEVVFVGETKVSGITVIVDHGGGLKSLYGNMSSTSVKNGDVLRKGDRLGIVGETGFCSGPSLHFGLYVFDVPVRCYTAEEKGVFISETAKELIETKE